jgi:hypothetical protein
MQDAEKKLNGRRADRAALVQTSMVAITEGQILRDGDGNILGRKPNRAQRRANAAAKRKP